MTTHTRKIVYVAMSGGVDSSVAAALLQKEGHEVRGVFMRYWGDVDDLMPQGEDFTNCCNIEAMNDAQRVCDHLGIPLSIIDLRGAFREQVVRHFLKGYEQGSTPNPCVECNRSIKFELIEKILSEASEQEKEYILFATGHYIRKITNYQLPITNYERLFVAKDTKKDQSYFLYTLTQEKLRKLFFPLGDYTKPEVRDLAIQFGLPVAHKKESQEVCFVKDHVNDFLASRLKNVQPGPMVLATGEVVGEHRGLPFYTLGQRQGLNLGSGGPYVVVEKKMETNTLVVARQLEDQLLYHQEVELKNVNWVSGVVPSGTIHVIAKPRYRHPGAPAIVNVNPTSYKLQAISCVFKTPERALTPGQSVVFYQNAPDGLEVIGGGIIDALKEGHL